MRKFIWVGLLLFFNSLNAGVFEDADARKAINAIQGQLKNIQANLQNYVDQRIDQLNKKQNPIQFQNDLKQLQELISQLNGQIEVVQFELGNLTSSQKTLYQDLSSRIADLETKLNTLQINPNESLDDRVKDKLTQDSDSIKQKSDIISDPQLSTDNSLEEGANNKDVVQTRTNLELDESAFIQEPLPEIKPKKLVEELPVLIDKNIEFDTFAEADNLLRATKYKDSFEAFDKFISTFPTSEKIVEAKYGLGYSQYALKNYRAAINTYSKIIDQHPQDPLVPEALYGIANCHIQLADIVRAKKTLRNLIQNHPNAEIISSAKTRLDALNAIKL